MQTSFRVTALEFPDVVESIPDPCGRDIFHPPRKMAEQGHDVQTPTELSEQLKVKTLITVRPQSGPQQKLVQCRIT
ncbi:hypothetical protein GSbR_32970 [Geobacter sp. SVR]|nr:hypothetical protein GSbR_32970 [Geobacter sp. SVR]